MPSIKIVVVGDAVGKTCLLTRYVTEKIPELSIRTVYDEYTKTVLVKGSPYTLSLHDAGGSEDYDRLRPRAYPQTNVFLVCFSVVQPASLDNVKAKWMPEVSHHCKGTPFLLVGTQCDLREDDVTLKELRKKKQQPVPPLKGTELAKEVGAVKYVECSALTQEGVMEVFDEAICIALSHLRFSKTKSKRRPTKAITVDDCFIDTKSTRMPFIKFVVVGDAVGKTYLLSRYVTEKIPELSIRTVYDEYTKTVLVNGSPYTLSLHDTGGSEDYDRLRPCAYPQTDVFLVCFSVVQPASLNNVKAKWVPEISLHFEGTPFLLVGTQCDLREDNVSLNELECQRPISENRGEAMARKMGAVKYVECSALTQEGLTAVFEEAIHVALASKKKGKCKLQ